MKPGQLSFLKSKTTYTLSDIDICFRPTTNSEEKKIFNKTICKCTIVQNCLYTVHDTLITALVTWKHVFKMLWKF